MKDICWTQQSYSNFFAKLMSKIDLLEVVSFEFCESVWSLLDFHSIIVELLDNVDALLHLLP